MSDHATAHSTSHRRLGIGSFTLLLDHAREQGLERLHCLQSAGVTPDTLDNPEAVIDASQELALIRLLVRDIGAPFRQGLEVGRRQGLTAHGVWGLGVMSAANGVQALQWGGRFASVAFPLIRYRWRLGRRGPVLLMDTGHLPEALAAFVIARDLASLWRIHRELMPGQPFGASELRLAIPDMDGLDLLRELYPCPVRTGQPHTGLTLDPATFQHPFAGANRVTLAQCEGHCRELIRQRSQRLSLSDRVRDFLRGNSPLPGLTEVAATFHVSDRSLRRQLNLEGTGWRQLRDEVLERRARQLLGSQPLTVEQVAEHLGYTETSSFSHAFKRWTGLSPAQFRQAQGVCENQRQRAALGAEQPCDP